MASPSPLARLQRSRRFRRAAARTPANQPGGEDRKSERERLWSEPKRAARNGGETIGIEFKLGRTAGAHSDRCS